MLINWMRRIGPWSLIDPIEKKVNSRINSGWVCVSAASSPGYHPNLLSVAHKWTTTVTLKNNKLLQCMPAITPFTYLLTWHASTPPSWRPAHIWSGPMLCEKYFLHSVGGISGNSTWFNISLANYNHYPYFKCRA